MPANDPIIRVFVWLNVVGKDEGSCELLMTCDKTGYIEIGKSKFPYAFADSTGPVCTSKMAYDLELVMTNFNENFHLIPDKGTTNFYGGSLFEEYIRLWLSRLEGL